MQEHLLPLSNLNLLLPVVDVVVFLCYKKTHIMIMIYTTRKLKNRHGIPSLIENRDENFPSLFRRSQKIRDQNVPSLFLEME